MKIPEGAQILIYPMRDTTISAGFKNQKYTNSYKYVHYGVDFDAIKPTTYSLIASGNGVILGTEFNSGNSLGNIIVVRYNKVYVPSQNKVMDLIVRYYHIKTITVKKGDKIKKEQVMGQVDSKHKWWNHIHMEIDYDVNYPFHTLQVAEASSKLLIAAGANSKSLLNPIDVLVIGKNQTAIVHPNAIYADSNDKPKYYEKDFITNMTSTQTNAAQTDTTLKLPSKVTTSTSNTQTNTTLKLPSKVNTSTTTSTNIPDVSTNISTKKTQQLILPINTATVTAGYKNTKYASKFGFKHFGLDIIGESTIYGSGDGTVLACGLDSILGNVIAIKYENVINHKTNKTMDVIMRYNHLAAIKVKKGDKVNKDTVLGIMGNTGKYSQGIHLHIEVDSDAREQYACNTPTLSGNGTIMKHGVDSTFNPAEILHVKTSAPDKQSIKRLNDGYSTDADINMKKIS